MGRVGSNFLLYKFRTKVCWIKISEIEECCEAEEKVDGKEMGREGIFRSGHRTLMKPFQATFQILNGGLA